MQLRSVKVDQSQREALNAPVATCKQLVETLLFLDETDEVIADIDEGENYGERNLGWCNPTREETE